MDERNKSQLPSSNLHADIAQYDSIEAFKYQKIKFLPLNFQLVPILQWLQPSVLLPISFGGSISVSINLLSPSQKCPTLQGKFIVDGTRDVLGGLNHPL